MRTLWEDGQHRWPRVGFWGRDRVVCEGLVTLGGSERRFRDWQRVAGILERGPRLQTPAKRKERLAQ